MKALMGLKSDVTFRKGRQELKYIFAASHDPVPGALTVSTETITLSRAIRCGGFEFALFFGLPLPIVG